MFKSNHKIYTYLNKVIIVSIGSIFGALIRLNLNDDLIVNIIGCLLIGFIVGYKFNSKLELFLSVGFCGALTTFSSWILDCVKLFYNGYFLKLISLIVFPVLMGLFVSAIGLWMGISIKHLMVEKNNFV